jgi:O-acetyl-ADP-ribose deacetylase (regulator of RNase III)
MSDNCPVYLNSSCHLKFIHNEKYLKTLFNLKLEQDITNNCDGLISKCSFQNVSIPQKSEPIKQAIQEANGPQEVTQSTKVSIHKCDNPYLVKSDVLVYPTNIILTIDDPLLHRMSRGNIQNELDKIKKPIHMGTIYVTSNGGENSNVKPKYIYHAVVAGESRLVNEEDIKSATRKSLHIANKNGYKNIVMMPPDCGTHDINDSSRVHLSAIKTFLQTEKECNIKNIFVVMSDQESYDVYEQYYKRIFK